MLSKSGSAFYTFLYIEREILIPLRTNSRMPVFFLFFFLLVVKLFLHSCSRLTSPMCIISWKSTTPFWDNWRSMIWLSPSFLRACRLSEMGIGREPLPVCLQSCWELISLRNTCLGKMYAPMSISYFAHAVYGAWACGESNWREQCVCVCVCVGALYASSLVIF